MATTYVMAAVKRQTTCKTSCQSVVLVEEGADSEMEGDDKCAICWITRRVDRPSSSIKPGEKNVKRLSQ